MNARNLYRSVRGVYRFGKRWAQTWTERLRLRPSILVYSMGKVGSSTLVHSLHQSSVNLPVYHVHFLSPKNIRRVLDLYRGNDLPAPAHLRQSHHLRRRIDSGEKNWLVITLFREPIGRKISDLFQNAPDLWPEVVDAEGHIDPDRARERVQEDLSAFDEEADYVCTWFDKELRPVFGVDIFDRPFDHDRGFIIREGPRAQVLVLRLEDLTPAFQPALKQFLPGRPEVDMVRANVRSNQEVDAGPYQAVKNELTVPRETAARIYSSRYVQHLYTDDMVERFLDRWCSS